MEFHYYAILLSLLRDMVQVRFSPVYKWIKNVRRIFNFSLSLSLFFFRLKLQVQVSYLRIIIARTFAGLMFAINNSNVKAPQKFVSSSECRLIAPNRFSRPGRMKRVRPD